MDISAEVKANRKVAEIIGDLKIRTKMKHNHALNMSQSAQIRANLYPEFEEKEKRIAKRWCREAEAFEKAVRLLEGLQKRL